uniref:Uncharacterized protein n=1 Tax=Oryza brachyantha TaxID=4533 RepID=J3L1N7_ORYBR
MFNSSIDRFGGCSCAHVAITPQILFVILSLSNICTWRGWPLFSKNMFKGCDWISGRYH